MTDDWERFRQDVPARFLLPLKWYVFTVKFVQYQPDASSLLQARRHITDAVLTAINRHPDCNPSALRFKYEEAQAFFKLNYLSPVFNFKIELHEDRLQFGKSDCTLEDLHRTLPLFSHIAEQLFDVSSVYSLRDQPFFKWVYRVSHEYQQYLTLGPRLTDSTVSVTNAEIMPSFVTPRTTPDSVLDVFQPEAISRADVKLGMIKTIAGRKRNVWVTIEAPWNVTGRDINIELELRQGASELADDITDEDYTDFETPTALFFRDYVLSRLYPVLSRDAVVMPKQGG